MNRCIIINVKHKVKCQCSNVTAPRIVYAKACVKASKMAVAIYYRFKFSMFVTLVQQVWAQSGNNFRGVVVHMVGAAHAS